MSQDDVISIDAFGRDAKTPRTIGKFAGLLKSNGRALRVLVCLNNEKDRQLPQGSHIEGFVDHTFPKRAVSHEYDDNSPFAPALFR